MPASPTPRRGSNCTAEVATIKPGQFVIGSFFASDNTCEICQAGYQSSCINGEGIGSEGAQAELMRVPLADGTLVATPDVPSQDLIPDFWRFPMCSALAGSGPSPLMPGRGRRLPWSAMARLVCSVC
jgi:hypothetical protein